jgi:L-ascorbate metabolism protein UlaG (beta-lactamase superfamily)
MISIFVIILTNCKKLDRSSKIGIDSLPSTPTIHQDISNDDHGNPRNAILHTQVCGFLVDYNGIRILIDALFFDSRLPIPNERLEAMQSGKPPFDQIDLILITHDHSDHFDVTLVGNNMLSNPDAILISTDVVVEKLGSFPDFPKIQERVIGLHLEENESEQVYIDTIDVEIFHLSHGIPAVPNFGYLITLGDLIFMHTGDMDPNSVKLLDLEAFKLAEREIDFAFVSGFRLIDPRYSAHILEGIQPKIIIPMHFNFQDPNRDIDAIFEQIETDFDNVLLFRREMTWETIEEGKND